jgi:lysophospholipase L1-like esterase
MHDFKMETIMKKKIFLRFSLILNIILILGILLISYKYREKIYEKIASLRKCNIVMFGDSLTAYGDWNKDLNRVDIRNSGTGGFTTSHFVMTINTSVLKYNPQICFIEGGINDIGVGIPLSRTYKNYESIVDTLLKHKIEPILQSTLYVNYLKDSITNSKVDSLNYFISNLAVKRNIIFLDLNLYLSHNKRLKKEFSKDGVHIKENAYEIWIREIAKILKSKGL